jgi:hypothetical protein
MDGQLKARKVWAVKRMYSRVPQHVTLTERVGVNLTRHRCPHEGCGYVSEINWATNPFTRTIVVPSGAPNRSTLHVDRETVMEVSS